MENTKEFNEEKLREIFELLHISIGKYQADYSQECFEAAMMVMGAMITSVALGNNLVLEEFLDRVFNDIAHYAYGMETQVREKFAAAKNKAKEK